MSNIVTIHVIRKTSWLARTLKTLLLSLAVSDVGVGLLGQPLYISLLVVWLQQNDPGCNRHTGFVIIFVLCSLASFFGVVAVSVDRFLAIHLHLRYQELVTHKVYSTCFFLLSSYLAWRNRSVNCICSTTPIPRNSKANLANRWKELSTNKMFIPSCMKIYGNDSFNSGCC